MDWDDRSREDDPRERGTADALRARVGDLESELLRIWNLAGCTGGSPFEAMRMLRDGRDALYKEARVTNRSEIAALKRELAKLTPQ